MGMPKLNVSVPDAVWELAVKTSTVGPSPSAIVQDALRRQQSATADRAWMQPPDDAVGLLVTATQRLAEQALQQFQDGYRAALARIPDLSWQELDSFARAGFNLREWLTPWRNGIQENFVENMPELNLIEPGEQGPDPETIVSAAQRAELPWFWKLAEDLGSWLDPVGFPEYGHQRTDTYERGYTAGLRAAYDLVDRGAGTPANQ